MLVFKISDNLKNMSFLEALKKKKSDLKYTETFVKTAGGEVFCEKRDNSGGVSSEKVGSSEGYVVDMKPDLQVGAVLPGLYMGSQDVTQDDAILKDCKITHILSVGVQVQQLPGINYSFVEALDLPEFDMMPVFERCVTLIDEVRRSGGVVYVHCNAGVSRSAAVVIAYLMAHRGLGYQQAFDLLRTHRPCIKPNAGFVNHLKAYGDQML